jgi:hypothetical protein
MSLLISSNISIDTLEKAQKLLMALPAVATADYLAVAMSRAANKEVIPHRM